MLGDIGFLRRAVLLFGVIITLVAGCSPVKWEKDYQSGIKRAAQQRRRALVQFYAMADSGCHEMDREVFSRPEVQELVGEFVAIRLDYYLNRKLADELGVQVLPAFFVIRPDLTVAGSQQGKMDERKFRLFLIKHSYN